MLSVSETRAAALELTPASADSVERLIALEPAAWQELFDRYYRKMHSFAYVRTGDIDLAEEIASEVFAAAVKGIGSYRPTGAPFAAWLYRIARNITADHLDRRRRRPQTSLEAVEIESASWTPAIDEHTDLARGLKHLSREQQEVIALRFMSDCTLEETARALGKSVGAIKVLQHRALRALRRQLTREDG